MLSPIALKMEKRKFLINKTNNSLQEMPKEDNVEEIRQHIKMKEMNQLLMRKMIHQVNKTVSNNRKHIHHPRRLRMKPIKIKTLQKITILIKIEVKKITTFLKITNLKIKMIRKKALP